MSEARTTGTVREAIAKLDETLKLVRNLDYIIRGNGKPEEGMAFRLRKVEDWVDGRRVDADTDRNHEKRLDRIEAWMDSRQRLERTLGSAVLIQAVLVVGTLAFFVVKAFVFTNGDPSAMIGSTRPPADTPPPVYYPYPVEVGQGTGGKR